MYKNKSSKLLDYDKYGIMRNTAKNALMLYTLLRSGDEHALSFTLDLDGNTVFHMTLVALATTIISPNYEDGSLRGLQINIDRLGSYALPWGNPPEEHTYIAEKWYLTYGDAKELLPFLQTVLTGKDYYEAQS